MNSPDYYEVAIPLPSQNMIRNLGIILGTFGITTLIIYLAIRIHATEKKTQPLQKKTVSIQSNRSPQLQIGLRKKPPPRIDFPGGIEGLKQHLDQQIEYWSRIARTTQDPYERARAQRLIEEDLKTKEELHKMGYARIP